MFEKRKWLAGLCVGAALALGACGDDEENGGETTAAAEASPEEAVEQAVIDFGAADGEETCQFVSQEAIESVGGIEECEREFQDSTPTEYEIQDVQVNGDEATVTGERTSTGDPVEIKVVNEDGEWLVDPRQ